eukprot:TRINITY_DN16253_c0_g1_i2.p1 TRINITY_DN16253_c0_g1~~TRINITY_DN16253_c0_g1_i2.p1  ORF type:complete len:402 (+),score=80.01 TRINITY_DN16253_c0_g1_i2:59-1207(+)
MRAALVVCLPLMAAARYRRRDIWLPMGPYAGNNSANWRQVRDGVQLLYRELLAAAPDTPLVGNIWQYPAQTQHYIALAESVAAAGRSEKRTARICETGFGSGLSTLGWLLADSSTTVTTFDWFGDPADGNEHFGRRKRLGAASLRRSFGQRWRLVEGDSRVTVPAAVRGGLQCDLFHIDGAHVRGGVLADLRHMRPAARGAGNVVLLDDMHFREIQKGMEDFRSVRGVQLDVCHTTRARDPFFTFPGKKLSKKKVWCAGRFPLQWRPPAGWEAFFESVAGVTADGRALRPAAGAPAPPTPSPPPPPPAEHREQTEIARPSAGGPMRRPPSLAPPPDGPCSAGHCGGAAPRLLAAEVLPLLRRTASGRRAAPPAAAVPPDTPS